MARKAWGALSKSYRRRLRTAWGAEAEARYRRGDVLTRAQRGHAFTPQEPEDALSRPELYPRYTATHIDDLNEIARRRGEPEHGTGERGVGVTSYDETGDFTWVIPQSRQDDRFLEDYRFSTVFRSEEEAQLFARRSNAPAGVVLIVDRGPGNLWRYEVFFGYPETRNAPRGRRSGRMRDRQTTHRENIDRLRRQYEGADIP